MGCLSSLCCLCADSVHCGAVCGASVLLAVGFSGWELWAVAWLSWLCVYQAGDTARVKQRARNVARYYKRWLCTVLSGSKLLVVQRQGDACGLLAWWALAVHTLPVTTYKVLPSVFVFGIICLKLQKHNGQANNSVLQCIIDYSYSYRSEAWSAWVWQHL